MEVVSAHCFDEERDTFERSQRLAKTVMITPLFSASSPKWGSTKLDVPEAKASIESWHDSELWAREGPEMRRDGP